MEGTPPRTVASARPRAIASLENFGTRITRAPFISASKLTHRPKMKVSCSGSNTTSPASKASSRSRTASLSARRWWPTTAPFGRPVEPEVNITKAASRSSARSGGGAAAITSSLSPSTDNRAPVWLRRRS